MAFQSFRRAAFAAALISVIVATPISPRARRRAPVIRRVPITLEELLFTVFIMQDFITKLIHAVMYFCVLTVLSTGLD